MISKSIAPITVLALLAVLTTESSLSAQDRGPSRDPRESAERFFGYMDRNKDGRLDAEEMRRMPGSFREGFERAEIRISNGISREQFVREMPRIMEESRRRREEEYRNRSSSNQRSSSRGDDSRRNDDRRKESSYVYTPAKRDPVTMKIPRSFEDGDTDKDGQIGLYEWRQWRPDQKYHFRVYDINGDGFLTPKELSIPPTQEEINNYLTSIGVKVDTSSSSRSGRFGRSRDGSSRFGPPNGSPPQQITVSSPQQITVTAGSNPGPTAAQEDSTTKKAKLLFKSMDRDKNGSITSEEWLRSRTIKPRFEDGGYDLSKPMDEQQFIAAYRDTEK